MFPQKKQTKKSSVIEHRAMVVRTRVFDFLLH